MVEKNEGFAAISGFDAMLRLHLMTEMRDHFYCNKISLAISTKFLCNTNSLEIYVSLLPSEVSNILPEKKIPFLDYVLIKKPSFCRYDFFLGHPATTSSISLIPKV